MGEGEGFIGFERCYRGAMGLGSLVGRRGDGDTYLSFFFYFLFRFRCRVISWEGKGT